MRFFSESLIEKHLFTLNMFCSDSISILNFIACADTCRIQMIIRTYDHLIICANDHYGFAQVKTLKI